MIPLLFFGTIVGSIIHWIQPQRSTGGYIGAALLGSIGAVLGSIIAIATIESITTQNIFLPSFLLMTVGLFSLFAPRQFVR